MVNKVQSEKAEYWETEYLAYEIFMFELLKIKISLFAKKKEKNLQAAIPIMCFSLEIPSGFFHKNSQNSHCYAVLFFLHIKAPVRI